MTSFGTKQTFNGIDNMNLVVNPILTPSEDKKDANKLSAVRENERKPSL